ncbi:hypothetical protein ACS0TY_002043 [Phlomoides rotata]
MEKKLLIVLSMILLIVSANMETVNADAFDCFDSCIKGCVNPDPRLTTRCERKCRIRCDPAREANGHLR